MELKEMIMTTLSELEDEKLEQNIETTEVLEDEVTVVDSSEKQFYENIREKLLVIFEGFQAPNSKSIESKIDMTLNFLEYLLARIDERLEILNTTKK